VTQISIACSSSDTAGQFAGAMADPSLLLSTNLAGYRLSKQIGCIGAPAISLRSGSRNPLSQDFQD